MARCAERIVSLGGNYISWPARHKSGVNTIGSQRFVNIQESADVKVGVGIDARIALSLMPKHMSKS
jgi:hypothetical protein